MTSSKGSKKLQASKDSSRRTVSKKLHSERLTLEPIGEITNDQRQCPRPCRLDGRLYSQQHAHAYTVGNVREDHPRKRFDIGGRSQGQGGRSQAEGKTVRRVEEKRKRDRKLLSNAVSCGSCLRQDMKDPTSLFSSSTRKFT